LRAGDHPQQNIIINAMVFFEY